MQQPPPSVNGGELNQAAVRHPRPPVTKPSIPPPQFPPTPGNPAGYNAQPPGAFKMPGPPMNGPPSGPPPLRGPDLRPPLVNGQPGPPQGPPAWPPSGPPPRPIGASPSRINVSGSAPISPALKPPNPNPTNVEATMSLPNGYQRPSPPVNLPGS